MSWPKRLRTFILLFLIIILLIVWASFIKEKILYPTRRLHLLKDFTFSKEEDLKEWDEKIFKGRVKYEIDEFNKDSCVYAKSTNTASALYYKIKVDIEKHPILSWKWNVLEFPKKKKSENLLNAEEDDYGARIYVIFPALFVGGGRALEYIWAEHAPKGTISSSPYTSKVKLIVLESGKNETGNWIYKKRNLYQDFIKAFGEELKAGISAIAFMTDADSTKSTAEAVYDDIKIEYKRDPDLWNE